MLGRTLAQRSLHLEEFCASYIIDAQDFFRESGKTWTWTSLRLVSLTSRLLVHTTDPMKVNCLLKQAGTVALQMPKLREMNIWNGSKGNASTFQYRATDDYTQIRWRSTWALELDTEVIDAWQRVDGLHTLRNLTIQTAEFLDKESILSHGHTIQQLGLDHVIHQVSLKQVLDETRRYLFKYMGGSCVNKRSDFRHILVLEWLSHTWVGWCTKVALQYKGEPAFQASRLQHHLLPDDTALNYILK